MGLSQGSAVGIKKAVDAMHRIEELDTMGCYERMLNLIDFHSSEGWHEIVHHGGEHRVALRGNFIDNTLRFFILRTVRVVIIVIVGVVRRIGQIPRKLRDIDLSYSERRA